MRPSADAYMLYSTRRLFSFASMTAVTWLGLGLRARVRVRVGARVRVRVWLGLGLGKRLRLGLGLGLGLGIGIGLGRHLLGVAVLLTEDVRVLRLGHWGIWALGIGALMGH